MAVVSTWSGRFLLAAVRIALGVIFFFFAQYKIFRPEFVHSGFQKYVGGYIQQGMTVHWMVPFITRYVLTHPMFWARVVAWSEMLIAVSLIAGLWVRWSSLGGILFMLTLALMTWWAPGYPAPKWRYLGANLDHISTLFLFVLFYALQAGQTLGLDSIPPFRRK